MSIYADLEVKCSSKDSGLPEDHAVARNIKHGSLAFASSAVRAMEVTAKVVALLLLIWAFYTAIHKPTAGVSDGV
eukprot:gene39112-47589_t